MKNYIYTHLGMSGLLKFDEKTAGIELNIVLFSFRFFLCVVFVGLDGPCGGFGAPGGGFSGSSSSGKPLLLQRLA